MVFRTLACSGSAAMLALAVPAAVGAQTGSASANIRVSAQVVPSCRIADSEFSRGVQLHCSPGISIPPRVHVVESTHELLFTVNF